MLLPRAMRLLAVLVGLLLTFFAACLVSGAFYEPDLSLPSDVEGKQMLVRGVRLRVSDRGRGPALLFVHGSSGSLEDFERLVPELEGEFRCITYDRPGHGFSGDPGDTSYAYNADIALALLEALDLSDVIVVGHSYGGDLAAILAARNPERIRGYVILDSGLYRRAFALDLQTRLLSLPLVGHGMVRLTPTFVLRALIERRLREEFKAWVPDESFFALRSRIWASPKVLHAMAQEWTRIEAELAEESPRYAGITSKVQVLAQADEPARRRSAEAFARTVSGAEMTPVERSGHYLQLERPDAVLAALRKLVSDLDTRAAGQVP